MRQVQLYDTTLRDGTLVAPIAGIVAKRHVQPGEKVAFDSPLVTVVDLKDMELQAVVPAVDVPALAIGMPVDLAIDGFGERRCGNGAIGVQAPLGFFDPLGYLEDGDQERFEHLRWVELKVSPIFCTDPCNWASN